MRLVDGEVREVETTRLSHCLETCWKEELGMQTKALLYHADEPLLNLRMLELLTCRVIADKGSLLLADGHAAHTCFL